MFTHLLDEEEHSHHAERGQKIDYKKKLRDRDLERSKARDKKYY